MTDEQIIAALSKPLAIKRLREALGIDPHKPNSDLDDALLRMRDQGILTFNPNTGLWSRNGAH
jgi:hypothetical protein